MDSRRGRGGRNRNVFKGSVLVSILLQTHPRRFRTRALAVKFAKRLLREGYIKSIFGSKSFEDSAQLYMWQDDDAIRRHRATMTSSGVDPTTSHQERIYESQQRVGYESLRREEVTEPRYERLDIKLIEDVKNKVLNRSEAYNIVTSYNTFFQELQRDFRSEGDRDSEHSYYNQAPPGQQQIRQLSQQLPDHHQNPKLQQQQQLEFHRHQQNPSGRSPQKLQLNSEQLITPSQRDHHHHLPHTHQSQGRPLAQFPQGQPTNTPQSSQTYNSVIYHEQYNGDVKRESTCSTDSSLDTQTYFRTRDRNSGKSQQQVVPTLSDNSQLPQHSSRQQHPEHSISNAKMASPARGPHTPPQTRDYNSIAEEKAPLGAANTNNTLVERDKECQEIPSSSSSHLHNVRSSNMPSSPENLAVVNGVGTVAVISDSAASRSNRWAHEPTTYSYSDNEKQLIEEMKRMKKEHQDILRTYEGRINKLMAKMHELRNIAEMLENSSNKSSPYGLLPAKATLLNIIASGARLEDGDKKGSLTGDGNVPPPLPPRPGRGGRIYPNKPIIHTRTRMKTLGWNRIILGETGTEGSQSTVWHGMLEAKFDPEELERLYSSPPESSTDDVTLLDDIYAIRGRPKHQMLAMFDAERSQRVLTEMRNLRCSLNDVINAVSSLDSRHLHQDSFAELLELLNSPRDVDKIMHHVKRKGPGQLDTPEFLLFQMSKLDHFRERLEFLRFKNKLQINLFEIDQQLRELNTACEELMNNLPLKNVLETVLALGNYINGGTDRGQADGFELDILNKLKDFVDRARRGNFLELIMRTYCLQYESDLDLGCPTRFRLPEPSNMRHAAQVSFDEIQKALRDLREELSQVRDRLEVLSKRESSNLTIVLRVTSENFLTSAVEVLAEEKRFLEDTKGHFWKTTAYFLYSRQCSPQEFFQIWATFLHDCKYYWKLAHRNLARDKFERDFSTKCQLSCSSLPGFTNLKNKMIRTMTTLQNDQEMRASKARQLEHINSWIESLGRYDQDLAPSSRDAAYGNGPQDPGVTFASSRKHYQRPREIGMGHSASHQNYPGSARSSSPKPITSIPPNVPKPQPINHTSPATVSSTYSSTSFPNNAGGMSSSMPNSVPYNSNQHFQNEADLLEDPYEYLGRDSGTVSQEADQASDAVGGCGKGLTQDSMQKKNSNFSLKSWLKRDQRQQQQQGNCNDESPVANGQTSQYPLQPKTPTTTPFNKLRNSVVQKLAGSGSGKKANDGCKPITPAVPPKPPRALTENEHPPSHRILFTRPQQETVAESEANRDSRDMPEKEARDYQNYPRSQSQGSKERGSSRDHEAVLISRSSTKKRDRSPNKHGAVTKEDISHLRDSSRDKRRHPNHKKNMIHPSEASQAQSQQLNSDSSSKESGGRNRAPIALNLGSNLSISGVYEHQGENPKAAQQIPENPAQPQHAVNHVRDEGTRDSALHHTPQPNNVDSKRVKANPVPIYKAKLIPNYENQTKLDPRLEHGIRGKAEPVHQPPVSHLTQSSNSSEIYRQELQRKSEMFVGNYPQQCSLPQTPFNQGTPHGAYPNQVLTQSTPQQGTSSRSQVGFQTPASQGLYSHAHQASYSQTTPKGPLQAVPLRSEWVGPVNPNSPAYDDFQTPARRSASAQNILERGSGTDGCQQSHTSDPSGPSHSYLAGLGDVASGGHPAANRREDLKNKFLSLRETRDRIQECDPAPAKVSALISRWEKKKKDPDDPMGGSLVDGQDNPPSMTSTPVTRRKHPPVPEVEEVGKNVTLHAQSQLMMSAYDVQSSGTMSNGFESGSGGPRLQGHERDGESADLYPHFLSSHQSQNPHRPPTHPSRTQAYSSHPHYPQHHIPGHPQEHQHPNTQNTHPSTNTYPPRSSHTPGRHPVDLQRHLDVPESYGEQLRKSSSRVNGTENGVESGLQSKPVPLPRQNIPGAMAVVKPTVMHPGPLSFMEI